MHNSRVSAALFPKDEILMPIVQWFCFPFSIAEESTNSARGIPLAERPFSFTRAYTKQQQCAAVRKLLPWTIFMSRIAIRQCGWKSGLRDTAGKTAPKPSRDDPLHHIITEVEVITEQVAVAAIAIVPVITAIM